MNAVTPQPALRRLRSIPSRPSHGNAALGHAGIAGLRRRSLVAALRAASSPFPPSPFRICVRRAAGKDGAGFPSRSHKRPAARAEAGVERSHAMRRCKCDPRWITVRFEGNCVRCKRPIHPGKRAFYYPEDRSLYCEADDCGKAASREFFGASVR